MAHSPTAMQQLDESSIGRDDASPPKAERAVKTKAEDIELPDVDLDELFGDIDIEQAPGNEQETAQETAREIQVSAPAAPQSASVGESSPSVSASVAPEDSTSTDQIRTPPSSIPPTPQPSVFNHVLSTAQADLNVPNVMENISALKGAIINNHLLLSRFFHLQAAYRTVSANLASERNLRAQAESTVQSLRQQLQQKPSSVEISPLQAQIEQLANEVSKQRERNATLEAQYKDVIEQLQKDVEKAHDDKAKVEQHSKERAMHLRGEVDKYRTSVVKLITEKQNLITEMQNISPQSIYEENKRLVEEMSQLRERVSKLEATNIRLRAQKSKLTGLGPQDATLQFSSPLRPSSTRDSQSIHSSRNGSNPTPMAMSAGEELPQAPSEDSDDDVVFMGANLIPTMRGLSLPSPTSATIRDKIGTPRELSEAEPHTTIDDNCDVATMGEVKHGGMLDSRSRERGNRAGDGDGDGENIAGAKEVQLASSMAMSSA